MGSSAKKSHGARWALPAALLTAGLLWAGNFTLGLTEIDAPSKNLPAGFDGFRIALITDLHGRTFGKNNDALVEKTCWQAIAPELELGMTTVGTSLQLAHTAPTPIGMVVQCDCEVLEVTDRRVRFGFRVYDDVTEVAGGEHERYLVDAERFLKKAESKI